MEKEKIRKISRSVVTITTQLCVAGVVVAIVKNVAPAESKIDKIKIFIAAHALGSLVAHHALKHAGMRFDEGVQDFEKFKEAWNKTAQ